MTLINFHKEREQRRHFLRQTARLETVSDNEQFSSKGVNGLRDTPTGSSYDWSVTNPKVIIGYWNIFTRGYFFFFIYKRKQNKIPRAF